MYFLCYLRTPAIEGSHSLLKMDMFIYNINTQIYPLMSIFNQDGQLYNLLYYSTTELDVATAEVATATKFFSLATNFSRLNSLKYFCWRLQVNLKT